MNPENIIKDLFREIQLYFYPYNSEPCEGEYEKLYEGVQNQRLKSLFSILHAKVIELFNRMNSRLPTKENEKHYWAEESRMLIKVIGVSFLLEKYLANSQYEFRIVDYYRKVFEKCLEFLEEKEGSTIPPHMESILLFRSEPIFETSDTVKISDSGTERSAVLHMVGSGSYAHVYKFKDSFYNKVFALKRALKTLSDQELHRFKLEFQTMKGISSPYVLEVYRYDEHKHEYIMEFADCTLKKYMDKYNNRLTLDQRIGIAKQVLRAFMHIHSKNILHRDISPTNVLVKIYDDVPVIKISDFGLVKTPENFLTDTHTAIKGVFNDPYLERKGFKNYDIRNETYALTKIIYYIMTGKTDLCNIKSEKLSDFVNKGLSPDENLRFQDAKEMLIYVNKMRQSMPSQTNDAL